MTERSAHSDDRIAVALDRGTRVMRLLAWTAMFALVCLMLWIVSAQAGDPKAAARAIGNAGNAAARAIAQDSARTADVPGYAGTNLPERNIGASRLRDEGRARLADPDDPGGAAGRTVVVGTTSRPAAGVPATDPAVSLKGDIETAFEKLGGNVAEVKPDNIAGAVAARWLALSPEARENTGIMAPSHELRQAINGHIRERLARDGAVHGPALNARRLVSKGYTNAERALAGNYAAGDVVVFHRPYKRLGVEKGGERRVAGVDHGNREVLLAGGEDGTVRWKPGEIAGRKGGSEVYRAENIELRAGDRIRWTRNHDGLGIVNSATATVESIAGNRVTFALEDGRKLELGRHNPQLRHLDHAWASTVHAFQGRTVDRVIAAMEARHRHLTTRKSFYVEISRARDRAELVTDNAEELKAQLEAVTGERIAALEGIGETKREAPSAAIEREGAATASKARDSGDARLREPAPERPRAPKGRDRGRGGMDHGL